MWRNTRYYIVILNKVITWVVNTFGFMGGSRERSNKPCQWKPWNHLQKKEIERDNSVDKNILRNIPLNKTGTCSGITRQNLTCAFWRLWGHLFDIPVAPWGFPYKAFELDSEDCVRSFWETLSRPFLGEWCCMSSWGQSHKMADCKE